MVARVGVSFEKLGTIGQYPASDVPGTAQLGGGKKSLFSLEKLALVSTGFLVGSAAACLMRRK